jgi:hypothetical protein
MAMAAVLPIITNQEQFNEQLITLREPNQALPFLSELGGGVLRFAGVVFPGVSVDNIFAEHSDREPGGRGPHFDIHGFSLEPDFPWLGVFNLFGEAEIRTAHLPKSLSNAYAELFPEPEDAAYAARRHFGALALSAQGADVLTGTLHANTGIIIPQFKDGPHVVHEVIPKNSGKPGEIIKMFVPSQDKKVIDDVRDMGYIPLDELTTEGLGGHVEAPKTSEMIWLGLGQEDEEELHPSNRRLPRSIPSVGLSRRHGLSRRRLD